MSSWPQGVPLFQHLCDRGTDGDPELLRRLIGSPTRFDVWLAKHVLERQHA